MNVYQEIADDEKEIKFVLENLCEDCVIELKKLFGENYKDEVFKEIIQLTTTKHVVKLVNFLPVGLFGLLPLRNKTAGIFLLTTDELHKGNIVTFLREAKKQVNKWMGEYELLLDNCYKKNEVIKKWLKLLGFKASKYQDEDFQIYYRSNTGFYYE